MRDLPRASLKVRWWRPSEDHSLVFPSESTRHTVAPLTICESSSSEEPKYHGKEYHDGRHPPERGNTGGFPAASKFFLHELVIVEFVIRQAKTAVRIFLPPRVVIGTAFRTGQGTQWNILSANRTNLRRRQAVFHLLKIPPPPNLCNIIFRTTTIHGDPFRVWSRQLMAWIAFLKIRAGRLAGNRGK